MNAPFNRLQALGLVAGLACAALALADHRSNLRQHEGALKATRQQMDKVIGQANKAQTDLAQATEAVKSERASYAELRKLAQEQHPVSPEFAEARKEAERAEAKYELTVTPLRRTLMLDVGYQSLVRERDEKRRKLASIPASDRADAAAEALAAARAVESKEREALADPLVRDAELKRATARLKLKQLEDARDEAIGKLPDVSSAARHLAEAERRFTTAQETFARAQAVFVQTRQQLANAEQEHARLAVLAAQEAASAPPPKKGDGKKKKGNKK